METGILWADSECVATDREAKRGKIDGWPRRGVRKRRVTCIAEAELIHRRRAERLRIANGEKLRLPLGSAPKVAERAAGERVHEGVPVDEVVERQHAEPGIGVEMKAGFVIVQRGLVSRTGVGAGGKAVGRSYVGDRNKLHHVGTGRRPNALRNDGVWKDA